MNAEKSPNIIVAGKIYVAPENRAEFIKLSLDSVTQARQTVECADFAVSADPLESGRVNIYEVWISKQALNEFRELGLVGELSKFIERMDITEYRVSEFT